MENNCFNSLFPPENTVYFRNEKDVIIFPHSVRKQTLYYWYNLDIYVINQKIKHIYFYYKYIQHYFIQFIHHMD